MGFILTKQKGYTRYTLKHILFNPVGKEEIVKEDYLILMFNINPRVNQ